MAALDSDGNGEKIWVISERIRGKCLQGEPFPSELICVVLNIV